MRANFRAKGMILEMPPAARHNVERLSLSAPEHHLPGSELGLGGVRHHAGVYTDPVQLSTVPPTLNSISSAWAPTAMSARLTPISETGFREDDVFFPVSFMCGIAPVFAFARKTP